MLEWIQKWGYLGLFLGSLIEGESIVLAISSMAYYGKFYLPKVILIAMIGTLLADQLSFFIGRALGHKLLHHFPNLEQKAEKVFRLLEKYDVPFILGFRFVYGIRIVSPFFIGISNISTVKFSVLNFLSAAIWSVLSCILGYYIGAFSKVIGQDYGWIVLAFNLLITVLIIIIFHIISKRLALHTDKSK